MAALLFWLSTTAQSLKTTTSRSLSSAATTGSRKLHYEVIENNVASSATSTLFLHGLLGNGKNLRALVKAINAPYSVLMDLRGHGMSPSFDPPHNFLNCALDVKNTLAQHETNTLSTIVGHSFGGRIALELAHHLAVTADDNLVHAPTTTWLLDTVPGQANESVERVLAAVDQIQLTTTTTKRDIVPQLQDLGIEFGLAQWLASSLRSTPDDTQLEWGFNVNVAQCMLEHFNQQDFLGMVEEVCNTSSDSTIHLVRGGKNKGWGDDPTLLPALEKLSKRLKNFHLHVLPKAGHWVHVDDLKGLVQLFQDHR